MEISLNIVSLHELLSRIALACIVGFFLGYDRTKKDKPIGVQSYMIICITTCLLAVGGQEMYAEYKNVENVISIDLGKVISGALTGIGFLGAGAIIKRSEDHIIGTATGASIWAAGGLGLIIGFGLYTVSIIGFMAIWAILTLLPKVLKHFE